jgi:hypothetical protein
MKKYKLSILIALFLGFIVFIACSKENSNSISSQATTFRADFIKGKSFDETKNSFDKLTTIEKYDLWNEKLDQLLSENLPNEHMVLIKELKIELVNIKENKFNRIPELAIQLAEITPKNDFIRMFAELGDYKYNGKFSDNEKVSADIINTFKIVKNNNLKSTSILKLPNCNCSWTFDSTVGGSTSNCIETTSGCGFMWQFPCTGKVLSL